MSDLSAEDRALMKSDSGVPVEYITFNRFEDDIDDDIEELRSLLLTPGLPDWYIAAIEHRIDWLSSARPEQMPPEDDYYMWLYLAGRGAGKTRSCAEDCFWFAVKHPGVRVGIITPRYADIQGTCFEGESGLVGLPGTNGASVIPRSIQAHKDFKYNRSTYEITLPNGSYFKGFTSENPESLRGPQFHRLWFDELAAWSNMQEVFDQSTAILRLSKDARGNEVINSIVASTTPRPRKLIKALVKDRDVIKSKGKTIDNIANLGTAMIKKIESKKGSDFYKQEYLGELLDFDDVAVPRKNWQLWPKGRKVKGYEIERIVISLDTGYKDGKKNDSSACTVWAIMRVRMMKQVEHKWLNGYTDRAENVWIVLLLSSWKEKLIYPDLKAKVKATYDKWKDKYLEKMDGEIDDDQAPIDIVIEDKASGTSLLQEFERAGLPVIPFKPGSRSKKERVDSVSEIFRSKKVYAYGAYDTDNEIIFVPTADAVITQFEDFTGRDAEEDEKSGADEADIDDLVDAAVAGLHFIRDQGYIDVDSDTDYYLRMSQEELDDEEEDGISEIKSLYG